MQKISLMIFILMTLTACAPIGGSGFGTVTGNGLFPQQPVDGPAMNSNVAESLCSAMCVPASGLAECETQVENQPGLAQLLGVPDATASTTLGNAGEVETPGAMVQANTSALSACLSEIPCTSISEVNQVVRQIPSCASVYSGSGGAVTP